jgi:hypothetical protein
MTKSEFEQKSARHSSIAVVFRRLRAELPPDLFRAAFANFSNAAQAFATSLSEERDRKFALRYLEYLQEHAYGSESPRPNPIHGRPSCTLVRAELERLFRSHFLQARELATSRCVTRHHVRN